MKRFFLTRYFRSPPTQVPLFYVLNWLHNMHSSKWSGTSFYQQTVLLNDGICTTSSNPLMYRSPNLGPLNYSNITETYTPILPQQENHDLFHSVMVLLSSSHHTRTLHQVPHKKLQQTAAPLQVNQACFEFCKTTCLCTWLSPTRFFPLLSAINATWNCYVPFNLSFQITPEPKQQTNSKEPSEYFPAK